MENFPIWVLPFLIFLIFPTAKSEEKQVKESLIEFMNKLLPENEDFGWNMSSDPCRDKWVGVTCNKQLNYVRKIVLDLSNFRGIFDANSVCEAKSLVVLSLQNNKINGLIPEEIANCKYLTHLYLSGNQLSGDLPISLSKLSNLKRLDISNNNFYGQLPDFPRISGLISFLAQNNKLSGMIPDFDFLNLMEFNVSNNNFSGSIPDVKGRFTKDSFLGNPDLCGKPLTNYNDCRKIEPALPGSGSGSEKGRRRRSSTHQQVLIYSGYIILGVVVVLFILFKKFISKKKPKEEKLDVVKKNISTIPVIDDASNSNMPSTMNSMELKNVGYKSEYSLTSVESSGRAQSLVVLTSPIMMMGLTFEELLTAPAELLEKGKHGSVYKVMLKNGIDLVVRRIKGWGISSEDFKRRMKRIDQLKHPNVLSPVAFYSSKQEKLLVYEFQQNGSLFKLLHESQSGQVFDWGSRLGVAYNIAEAMAFMHEELHEDGIAHGNLKSMNILFNKAMEPCIGEYGLMVNENQDQSLVSPINTVNINDEFDGSGRVYNIFKVDVYAFGVILLELLTGKLVQVNGFDLPNWVLSVVKEEWTVEVFDRVLISECANEERMVNLLQIALKCINPSPHESPTMTQVSKMINSIKEDEEKSISFDP